MLKPLPVLTALVMVSASGLVHTLWSERWHNPVALEEAVAQVSRVPLEIGRWKGKPQKMDAEEFAGAGAQGYWMRRYSRRNQSLMVLLMCGRSGRMAIHTPEFCYQGLGYQMVGAPEKVTVPSGPGGEKAEFWSARFVKQMGTASDLRLFWGWNASGVWRAPSSPRWEFRGQLFLYKLYVVGETSAGQRLEDEPALEFLRQFLPETKKVL